MNPFYDKYIERENTYYLTLPSGQPQNVELTPRVLNDGINWLVSGSRKILDFGCGSGGLAFLCALRGAEAVLGIDLAKAGIELANACATYVPQCRFVHGSIELLRKLPDRYYDALILSNILDNMCPEDSLSALAECTRVLKPGGKAFIKLNPCLSQEQIANWNIRILEGDLLDDGLLLWNKDDEFWLETFQKFFCTVEKREVYYQEYEKTERLFLCYK